MSASQKAAVLAATREFKEGLTPVPRPPRKTKTRMVYVVVLVVGLQVVFAFLVIRHFIRPPPSERYVVFNANVVGESFDSFVVGSDGRFEAVGNSKQITNHYWNLKKVDLKGKTVTPGLVDSHAHLLEQGLAAHQANIVKSKSIKEVTSRLIRYLNLNPDITPESGKWILGFGWDQTLWPGSEFPTASDLDSNPRLAAIPISLVRIDGHALWCNSLALQLSKASIPPADVPTPGGQVIRFPSNSAPTGVFLDDAMSFIQSNIPPPSYEQRVQAVETASRLMLEKGLTGLHDAGVSLDDISLFKSLIEQNKFPIRSYAMILCSPLSICTDTPLPPPYTTSKSGLLTVRAVKLVSDGALGSWGASLHSPYSDSPSKSGIQKISQEDLQKALTTTITQGYQPAIHAIGDRANAIALDTLESLHLHLHLHLHLTPPTTATPPNLTSIRPRIEHAQVLTPQDIPRFKSLGVIPSLQPTHTTSDMGFAVSRLGLHRAKTGAYRVRSLWPAPFGSDFPIEGVDPMRGIYSATTRKWENGSSPDGEGVGWIDEERVSRREALDGFTKWAAWARFGEKEMGRVAVGMWADYVVYEEDWVKEEEEGGGIGEQDLLKVVPLATVVGGVVRFGKLM